MPRRLLLMVRELHRRGYERLRASPGLSPSGCHWRFFVTPVSNIRCSHGARVWNHGGAVAFYTSAHGAHCFGWPDASGDSPVELATKFLDRCAELCASAHGPDEAYARWYAEMLEATEPDGLIYAYADWELPIDRLPFLSRAGHVHVHVPLPPPGHAGNEVDPRSDD
jgi:hypothetical protein